MGYQLGRVFRGSLFLRLALQAQQRHRGQYCLLRTKNKQCAGNHLLVFGKGMFTANVDTFYRGAGFKNAENGVCARRANLVA